MNTHSIHRRLLLLIALLLAPGFRLAAQTSPYVIPFQGRLTNQQGVAYSSGQYTIVFNIYSQSIGGTTQWTERHEKVGVTNGMISVFLGSITPLPTTTGNPPVAFFSTTRYLGITVDADDNAATADPEMVPRQMIIPAFHAKNADKMASQFGNYDWSVVFGTGNDPGASNVSLTKIPTLTVDKLPNSIPASKLEVGAALANLTSSGVSGVTSGGIVLSANPNDTLLLDAGYTKLGVGQFGEGWRQMANATITDGGGGINPYAVGNPVYCWTGAPRNEFISWGGGISTSDTTNVGARFNVLTGVWTPMSTVNAPTKRATAFHGWTGTELVLWGGSDGVTTLTDGKIYNPATDTWTDLPPLPAEVSLIRRANSGNRSTWINSPTLNALFIWGGSDGSPPAARGDGALLRKSGGTWSWTQISTTNAPNPRYEPCVVWTGSKIIVWGGYYRQVNTLLNDGKLYDPFTNTWSPTSMSTVNAPSPRGQASFCWTGTEMIVWGGFADPNTNAATGTGAAYNPTTDQWRTLPSAGLSARFAACSEWTGTEFVVWGGTTYNEGVYNVFDDGARYSPTTNSWTKLPSPGRLGVTAGASAWTGAELLLFGGTKYTAGSWRNDIWSYTPPRTLYLFQRN
ncbi:MAG: hypothetical protein JNM99_16945 [Verrucomicrobiaceae bacterium]|nr:hypothetical protein [Verrucomicrobiaceae bacterium]